MDLSKVSVPPTLQSYMDHHINSKLFKESKQSDILKPPPPPPPPFDFQNNPSLKQAVLSVFLAAISKAFPQIQHSTLKLNKLVAPCNNAKHGDYQCIAAMQLFKPLKASGADVKSPQQVAQTIIDSIDPNQNPVCTDFIVNGPGFIICKISPTYLTPHVNSLLTPTAPTPDAGVIGPKAPITKPEKVVVDFSSPNAEG